MPCALPPTASRCCRLAGHPVPAPIQRAAAAPARAASIVCHAAAAAPPAPRPAVDTERRQAAGGPLPSTSTSIGTHPAPDSWLAYSWRLRSNPPGVTDIVLERLRRQLGWGGRWAWQWELEGESDDDEEAELLSDADGAEAAASSSGRGRGSSRARPVVRSSRGGGRRSGARRQCRGQALMGAGAYGMGRPWREADALPAELQVGRVGCDRAAACWATQRACMLDSALLVCLLLTRPRLCLLLIRPLLPFHATCRAAAPAAC